jgi:hypothetical protein
MNVDPTSASCAECGSALAGDQRYCLECGARVGPRSHGLEQRLRGLRRAATAGEQRSGGVPPAAAAPGGAGGSGLRLPSPKISTLLVFAFLGFGALIGHAASSPVDRLASARSPVKLVLPAVVAPPASTSSAATAPSSSAEATLATVPSGGESPTPAPAAAAPARTPSKAVKTPARNGAGAGGGSSHSQAHAPSSAAPSAGSGSKLPPVKHVFVIMLSDEPYAAVFGPESGAPYLAQTLEHQGELLVRYYAVAHEELANEVALISGQGPTAETAANCPTYADIAPSSVGADEQVSGSGCVYPPTTSTLAGELSGKHLSWRAYVEGMDETPAEPGACGHPAAGQADPTAAATLPPGQTYTTFRNPFVYFQSITAFPECAADDVGLNRLSGDLADPANTPSLSYIVPDRCQDGSATPCAAGAPAGLAPANAFLKKVVPEILASKAYKSGGLLIITSDEAPSSGEFADSSACCSQPLFGNLPAPTSPSGRPETIPRGGGEVGALLLSPYVKPATTNQEPFNHFSLLRTIEDLFALKHLGYAAQPGVSSFGPSVFSAYNG